MAFGWRLGVGAWRLAQGNTRVFVRSWEVRPLVIGRVAVAAEEGIVGWRLGCRSRGAASGVVERMMGWARREVRVPEK